MFIFRPWTLGKIFGIPIRIDPSWVLIFLLLTYQLASFIFPYELGIRPRGIRFDIIGIAVIASLLLFVSVLAHELGHAYMAIQRGVPVLSITLFIFGGVAQIADEPDTPKTELLIAIVGPLVSLVIAIGAAAIWIWAQAVQPWVLESSPQLGLGWRELSVVAFYLAQTNLLLAIFNLLPGFPLDGGRVLRAVIWAVLHNQRKATYWGMVSGRALALLMVAGGLFIIVRGELSGGWLFLMAWFLWRAAGEAYHSMLARDLLKQVTVGEIMRTSLQRVSEALSLRELADSFASWLRPPALAVDLNGSAVGLVGIEQVRKIERANWDTTRVRQAMVPLSPDITVTPDEAALAALQVMSEHERDNVVVVQSGQVVGTLGREELARYLQTKGE